MKFICPKCGEVKPTRIYYSCPTQGDCPICNARLEDIEGGIKILSEEESRKIRPSFYAKNKGDEMDTIEEKAKPINKKRIIP